MRILSLAPTSFFNDYGCHVRILEEARALQSLGHDVTIVTYYKGKDVPGVRIFRTAPTPWHKDYEVGSSRHKFAFDALLAIRLAQVLSRNTFDLIHAHLHEGALIGSVIGKFWRVPVCFDFQGSLSDELIQHRFIQPNTFAHRAFGVVERLANRLPHAIVTSTRHAADTLKRELDKNIPIVPLQDGVNANIFHPNVLTHDERINARASYGVSQDDFVVGFLGLLAHHQGLQNMIDAAAILKSKGRQVKWLVMGYPAAEFWRGVADRAGVGDAMIFTGRVPYADAPNMLALCDIAVAPKLSLTEGSGKLLNYMAMGLPTVAFDTPAQRELLGSLGVYAPVGDTPELARCVAELMDRPEHRVALGVQLRQRAIAKFGWDRAALTLQSVYQELVEPSRERAVPARSAQTQDR